MSVLNKRYFTSEKMAFKHLESLLWPDDPVCPKCGSCSQPYDLAQTRVGLKKCRDCKKQFTVRIGKRLTYRVIDTEEKVNLNQ